MKELLNALSANAQMPLFKPTWESMPRNAVTSHSWSWQREGERV